MCNTIYISNKNYNTHKTKKLHSKALANLIIINSLIKHTSHFHKNIFKAKSTEVTCVLKIVDAVLHATMHDDDFQFLCSVLESGCSDRHCNQLVTTH